MNEERFSIGELATAAATTPRTIRFYTTEGLLPPPFTEGRNAIYTEAHRRRLRLIQRLKAAYLPLSAIKEQMTGLSDDQVNGLLDRTGPHRVENTGPPHTPRLHAQTEQPESSNVAYVAQILAVAEKALAAAPGSDSSPQSRRVLIVSPALRHADDSGTVKAESAANTSAAGDHWERITLRPGMELHVRQPISPADRAVLGRLIELSRSLSGDSP